MTSDADKILSWVGEQEMKGWEAERPSVGLSAHTRTYPPKDHRTIFAGIVRDLSRGHDARLRQHNIGTPGDIRCTCVGCAETQLALSRAAAALPKGGE